MKFCVNANRSDSSSKKDSARNRKDCFVKQRQKRKGVFSTLFISICIFAVLTFTVYRYQQVFATERQLNTLKNEIESVQQANERLTTQISIAENIDNIRQRATDELGMYFPNSAQLVEVELTQTPIAPVQEDELSSQNIDEAGGIDIMAVIKSFFE